MAREIEKKFLVKGDFKPHATGSFRVTQGYLSSVPQRTVRVRIKDDKGFITVKGIGNEAGTSRFEWEKEITLAEAKELLAICEPGLIDKTRYHVNVGAHTYEVDEFYGDNEGLVVAEVELGAEEEEFEKPEWLGEEVSGDSKYYNAMLMKNPFKNWN
jgi:adenylate cyclase